MPGQPDPVYPPGQFSSWNRPSTRAVWLGTQPASGLAPDAEPGYSVLAVSDPSADATSTQTWAAIDDTGWPASRVDRRRGPPDGGERPGRRSGGAHATGPLAVPAAAGHGQPVAPPGSPDTGAPPAEDGLAHRGGSHGQAGDRAPRAAVQESAQPAGGRGARAGHSRRADRGARRGKSSRPQATPASGRTGPGKRSSLLLASLLVVPVLVVGVVVAAYVYHDRGRPAANARPTSPAQPVLVPSSPAASLGKWKYIVARQDDPQPLSLAELFPLHFSASSISGSRTAERAGTHCPSAVVGSALRTAVRKASCTQVMRASYLSADRKLMATIGVLNLSTATEAGRVGKASGSSEFINQLPGAHGPTRNLKKGVGIEEAIVKGHYLILIVAEFADLHSPKGHTRRAELEKFETSLFDGTVNVSLSSRMVTGKPHVP